MCHAAAGAGPSRFGGRGSWRLGGDALAATRAALDDALTRAEESDEARVVVRETLEEAVRLMQIVGLLSGVKVYASLDAGEDKE